MIFCTYEFLYGEGCLLLHPMYLLESRPVAFLLLPHLQKVYYKFSDSRFLIWLDLDHLVQK